MLRKIKVKVFHVIVAIGAVGARNSPYLGHSIRMTGPICLLLLLLTMSNLNQYPITVGMTKRVYHCWFVGNLYQSGSAP